MRIAFLVLAHGSPRHLGRLVDKIQAEHSSVYVHLDAKVDIDRFRSGVEWNAARFLDERVTVTHAGFSQVLAILLLMRRAREEGPFDYYFTVSGQDYPIKTQEFMRDFLADNYPTSFLYFYKMNRDEAHWRNIARRHFMDELGRAPKLARFPIRVWQRILNEVCRERRFPVGLEPFRGATWFCASHQVCDHILSFCDDPENADFLEFFRRVWGADEIFFPTVVFNSQVAGSCVGFDRFLEDDTLRVEAYLHYVDWSLHRENPAILDLSDYDKLASSPAFFARKFDEKRSLTLCEKIDEEILHL